MKDEEDWISRIPNEDDMRGDPSGLSDRMRGTGNQSEWDDSSSAVPLPEPQEGGPTPKRFDFCFGPETSFLLRESV